jgi:hypothetical protein
LFNTAATSLSRFYDPNNNCWSQKNIETHHLLIAARSLAVGRRLFLRERKNGRRTAPTATKDEK